MSWEIKVGDNRETLKSIPDNTIDCCITSPPYFHLMDYGCEGQIGQEKSVDEFVEELVKVFHEVKRAMKDTGTLWINISDTYADDLNLCGVPWKMAFALQKDGWILRQCIIWNKPDIMPESVPNRFTKSYEFVFFFVKKKGYYFDCKSVMEDAVDPNGKGAFGVPNKYSKLFKSGIFNSKYHVHENNGKRRRRDVWVIPTSNYDGDHFAVYPEKLVEPMLLAGSPKGGMVLDPFNGTATTGVVAIKNGRNYIGCELNPKWAEDSRKRLTETELAIPHTDTLTGNIVAKNKDGNTEFNLF